MNANSAERGLQLTLEQQQNAESFYGRLNEADRETVETVISTVDDYANGFFALDKSRFGQRRSDAIVGARQGYYSRIIQDYEGACVNDEGYPFFQVFGIGGYVTKEGERKDVDLLVVTNASEQLFDEDFDEELDTESGRLERVPFIKNLVETMRHKFKVVVPDVLPDDYNIGETKGKAVLQCTPKRTMNDGGQQCRPIDLTVVRVTIDLSQPYSLENPYRCIRPEEFDKLDVDEDGIPLPKVLLYSSGEPSDITPFDEDDDDFDDGMYVGSIPFDYS